MKCPNCGKEVVIATDLCPWCGYEYSFDGDIQTKRDDGEREGGEDSRTYREDRQDARSYSGEEGDARERWTRAGVYNAASGTSSRSRSRRSESVERGMRWHNVVVNIILPLTGIYYIYRGVTNLMSSITAFSMGELLYVLAPWIGMLSLSAAVIFTLSGVAAFLARSRISRFLWSGVVFYIAVIITPPLMSFVLNICIGVYIDIYYGLITQGLQLIIPIAYAVATYIYYAHRRDLFN